jgi:hypothetical protein
MKAQSLVLAALLAGVAGPALAQATPAQPGGAADGAALTAPVLRAAWDGYYKALDEMRAKMEATPRYASNPQDRAKAYHTLMEMQAMAYNFIVAPRMTNPRIFKNLGWQTNIYTLGQNGPDFDYRNLFVDGSQTYRLTGHVGETKLNLIQVFDGVFGEPGVKTTGNYDLADMQVAKDGSFEIILGGPKREGNWIPLDPKIDYQYVFFRRALADWNDDAGDLKIERISPVEPGHYDADEFDEAAMAKRIKRAEGFIRYVTEDFNIKLYEWYTKIGNNEKNHLTLLPGTVTSQVGSPSSNYAMGIFHLADDEALLIEMPKAPDGAYWSFQVGDVWSRSLDFNERQTSLNMAQTKLGADGSLHIVLSAKDPGIANWIDTDGRKEGTLVFRNYRAKTSPVPSARKVKFSELAKLLPKDTVKVTPEQRAAAIASRQAGFLKHYGE